ncbi:MAG: MGH1-like glycoside hydrolase domain-containing protein [Solirubrobacteraceae bacterium]
MATGVGGHRPLGTAGTMTGWMSVVTEQQRVRAECERVLRENWREGVRATDGVPFHYTCPSPGHYPWQFYWDSCFSAIAWRHLAPERAALELRSLLAAQRVDGFIGHTIFWNQPLAGPRRYTYNVTSLDAPMTASIQPPLLAWAWRIAVGDPALEPGVVRHHDWLSEHRDLDGDGLLWIVQPDESGMDASTQFDAIWGHRAHGLAGFVLLVHRNRRLGYDLRRILAAGGPVACEVTTNVLYNLSRMALGLPSLTEALIERTYDHERGLFLPAARPGPRHEPATTIAALTPLALPDLPEEIGHRLVREHLLDPQRFWSPVPPPSVSLADPTFSLGDRGRLHQLRYWRGPTWINTAWLCWLGLVRLGYDHQADELARRLAATIAASGLREYYQPFTGAGMGAHDFAWSTLVLELLEADPDAARCSFLKRST